MRKLLLSVVSSILFFSVLTYAQTGRPINTNDSPEPPVFNQNPGPANPHPHDPLPPCHGQQVTAKWCEKNRKYGCEIVFNKNIPVACKCGNNTCPIVTVKEVNQTKNPTN
jgi:hypothetical protein